MCSVAGERTLCLSKPLDCQIPDLNMKGCIVSFSQLMSLLQGTYFCLDCLRVPSMCRNVMWDRRFHFVEVEKGFGRPSANETTGLIRSSEDSC